MKKCVSILVGILAVIAAAAAVLVALDRFRKQTDEDTTLKTEKGEAFASPFSFLFK